MLSYESKFSRHTRNMGKAAEYFMSFKSTWSYENRVSKHSVIVQYRIIFSFHLDKRINHPDPG